MDFLEKNKSTLMAVGIPALISALGWIGTMVFDGVELRGYNRAKTEIRDEYNEALRDAIIFRAKWESCCTDAN